ncbi:MAG TPA: NAD-dependent epimerase/dehydratase family protein [Terrimicrobiaceae bacterium]
MKDRILVTGAGGFIGGHLVAELLKEGHRVRAVDKKPQGQWYQRFPAAENLTLQLEEKDHCLRAVKGCSSIYNLAADMGGMGFIELNKGLCMLTVLIDTHMLMAARDCGAARFFYPSSACVYAGFKQQRPNIPGLKEDDAYPADPEDGYGWQKLFSERMCRHFREDFGLQTRVARYHNVYGPHGTFNGGREKAPAAICRKIIAAKLSGHHEIEIWGDGEQTRSFMFIDDCLSGTRALMESDIVDPLNIGSPEMVTINRLVDLTEEIAGIKVKRNYKPDAPKGVRGRSSDNTLIKSKLGWEPSIPLRVGLEKTYGWILDEMNNGGVTKAVVNRF